MGVVRARPFHHTKWATFFESWVTFRGLSRFKIVKSRESPSGRAFGRGAPSVPPETPHLAVPYPPSLSTRPACRWIYIYRQTDGPCFKWAYLRCLDIYIYIMVLGRTPSDPAPTGLYAGGRPPGEGCPR